MVRTKDVLLSFVQLLLVDYFERHSDQNEHEFRPPSVEPSHQPVFFGKNYGNQKQKEENYK
jgi:hypothetical protein